MPPTRAFQQIPKPTTFFGREVRWREGTVARKRIQQRIFKGEWPGGPSCRCSPRPARCSMRWTVCVQAAGLGCCLACTVCLLSAGTPAPAGPHGAVGREAPTPSVLAWPWSCTAGSSLSLLSVPCPQVEAADGPGRSWGWTVTPQHRRHPRECATADRVPAAHLLCCILGSKPCLQCATLTQLSGLTRAWHASGNSGHKSHQQTALPHCCCCLCCAGATAARSQDAIAASETFGGEPMRPGRGRNVAWISRPPAGQGCQAGRAPSTVAVAFSSWNSHMSACCLLKLPPDLSVHCLLPPQAEGALPGPTRWPRERRGEGPRRGAPALPLVPGQA